MNKIIDQNRTAILTAGESIAKILTALVNLGSKNHEDYLSLTKSPDYSSEFVQGKVKQMNAEYRANAGAYAPKLSAEFDAIETAGHALENALEIGDTELSSALQIIEASQGEIDLDTEGLIVSTFKGNQKALKIIRGVLQRFGKKTPMIAEYIFEIDSKMVFLRANIDTLTSTPYENPAYIFGLRSDLVKLCKLIGVEVPGGSFSLGENEEALSDQSMRKAFGLSV